MSSEEALTKIVELADKARRYATEDPEVSLSQARKAAEAIARYAFAQEIGEPGKIMLDAMLQKLAGQKVIPPSIQVPFGTLQAYGNFGAHAQSDTRTIDAAYVAPCIAALDQVEAWFWDQYVKQPRASAPQRGTASPAPSPVMSATASSTKSLPWIAILGMGALAAAGVVFFLVTRTKDEDAKPAPTVAQQTPVAVDSSVVVADAHVADALDETRPSETTSRGGLTLTYRVLAKPPGADAFHLVTRGESLSSETRVAIEVRVSPSAHVFIAQRTRATGEVAILFPDARISITNPLEADTWVQLPPSGNGYRLNDRDLGNETVYLIASKKPLPNLAGVLSKPKEVSRQIVQLTAAASERPECLTARELTLDDEASPCLRSRGLESDELATGGPTPSAMRSTEPSRARVVRSNASDDIVVAPFTFRHVK